VFVFVEARGLFSRKDSLDEVCEVVMRKVPVPVRCEDVCGLC